jgi:hypothetical protein
VGGINASKDKDVSPAKNERAQKKILAVAGYAPLS